MEEYNLYDEKYVPEPFGLSNTGVICWCNSLLQLLLSCPSLNRTLMMNEDEFEDNKFAKSYIKLLSAILPNDPEDPIKDYSRLSMASINILNSFICSQPKGRRFGNTQECVDEAMKLFLDAFDNPKVQRLFSNCYELTITCTNCNEVTSTTRDKAFNINMFCEQQLDTAEEFTRWIRYHPTQVDAFKCEKCGHNMRNVDRVEKLKMLREIVMVVFNKYQRKNNRWFPHTLEFPSNTGKTLTYKLIGYVEHFGNMNGGHYRVNVVRENQWYCMNDTSVTNINPRPTEETYVVAYHLVSNSMVVQKNGDKLREATPRIVRRPVAGHL